MDAVVGFVAGGIELILAGVLSTAIGVIYPYSLVSWAVLLIISYVVYFNLLIKKSEKDDKMFWPALLIFLVAACVAYFVLASTVSSSISIRFPG